MVNNQLSNSWICSNLLSGPVTLERGRGREQRGSSEHASSTPQAPRLRKTVTMSTIPQSQIQCLTPPSSDIVVFQPSPVQDRDHAHYPHGKRNSAFLFLALTLSSSNSAAVQKWGRTSCHTVAHSAQLIEPVLLQLKPWPYLLPSSIKHVWQLRFSTKMGAI